jgi:chemotaxis protein methyltransferase CheR
MLNVNDSISLSEEEFEDIRDFIHTHCGIYFDDNYKYIIEKRLINRIRENRLKNFRDYYYFLKYDKKKNEELNKVVDILTTNETYFFREEFRLKSFTDEILPAIRDKKLKEGIKDINIWSAGCSSGEEPYTIAILIKEKGFFENFNISIIATDISHRVLKLARRGVYPKYSFRTTDKIYIDKYFDVEEEGKWRIKDEIKNLVTFGHLNLLDSLKISLLRKMDVIFCRNVIIYFDNEARKRVIQSFYDKLEEGGYLLLGHSESLMNISTSFKLIQLKNDIVWQKPVRI